MRLIPLFILILTLAAPLSAVANDDFQLSDLNGKWKGDDKVWKFDTLYDSRKYGVRYNDPVPDPINMRKIDNRQFSQDEIIAFTFWPMAEEKKLAKKEQKEMERINEYAKELRKDKNIMIDKDYIDDLEVNLRETSLVNIQRDVAESILLQERGYLDFRIGFFDGQIIRSEQDIVYVTDFWGIGQKPPEDVIEWIQIKVTPRENAHPQLEVERWHGVYTHDVRNVPVPNGFDETVVYSTWDAQLDASFALVPYDSDIAEGASDDLGL